MVWLYLRKPCAQGIHHVILYHVYERNNVADDNKSTWFLLFSSTGHRPASLCHGLLCARRPSVR